MVVNIQSKNLRKISLKYVASTQEFMKDLKVYQAVSKDPPKSNLTDLKKNGEINIQSLLNPGEISGIIYPITLNIPNP